MQTELDPSSLPPIPDAAVAIMQTKWHRQYTDRMIDACVKLLRKAGCSRLEQHLLPGALELPLAVQTLVRHRTNDQPALDAVICFGAIMKGETYHFEMVVDECIRGLGQVMLAEDIPVIVEVIPFTNIDQLASRANDDGFNKGIEAALAAAEMIHWRSTL